MRVTVAGFLTDHKSRVLLRQIDRATLAPVHRELTVGTSPVAALAAAFREETGLVVLPVRPTGVYADSAAGALTICYRCTLRGGDLKPPAGHPMAGFFDARPLPRGLNAADRQSLDDALHHAGGPVRLARRPAGAGARLQRLLSRPESADPAVGWSAIARLIVDAGEAGILWAQTGAGGLWRLPATPVSAGEAPWEAAAALLSRLKVTQGAAPALRLIEIAVDRPALDFVFAVGPATPITPAQVAGDLTLARPGGADAAFDAADSALAREVLVEEATTIRLAS